MHVIVFLNLVITNPNTLLHEEFLLLMWRLFELKRVCHSKLEDFPHCQHKLARLKVSQLVKLGCNKPSWTWLHLNQWNIIKYRIAGDLKMRGFKYLSQRRSRILCIWFANHWCLFLRKRELASFFPQQMAKIQDIRRGPWAAIVLVKCYSEKSKTNYSVITHDNTLDNNPVASCVQIPCIFHQQALSISVFSLFFLSAIHNTLIPHK
jgi:hypothetical protein